MSAHLKEKAYRNSPFLRLMHLLVKWQIPWSHMSGQEGRQIAVVQRPSTGDREAWKAYWQAQGQPWRTEPEIGEERQQELSQRRTIISDIEYPFKDIRLNRADVEWLLATQGKQRLLYEDRRVGGGMDLRGANLSHLDLSNLPLEDVNLSEAHLERDNLKYVHLEKANLFNARLEGADLLGAHFEGAYLFLAHLENVEFRWGHLQGADLSSAHFEGANLMEAHLEGAKLTLTHLEGAILWMAHLEGANFLGTHLERTYLKEAHLAGAKFYENSILIDEKPVGPVLVDIQWGDANLTVINWSQVKMLGDEQAARKKKHEGRAEDWITRFGWQGRYEEAVRANRQLAVALQNEGLNEDASRFAYRAQKLQRVVLRHQHKFGQYLFSGFLDLLAGYGYRPGRSVIWYLIVIFGFALAYHFLGGLSLYPPDALIFSVMSFHGRGFFPSLSSETNLHNPLVMLAAVEAIVGLFIEISFIATFTQRFFGK